MFSQKELIIVTVITYRWPNWPQPGLLVPTGIVIPAFRHSEGSLLIDELEVEIYKNAERGILRVSFTPAAGKKFDNEEARTFLIGLIETLDPKVCSWGYSDYAFDIVAEEGEDIEKVMMGKYQQMLQYCGIPPESLQPHIDRQHYLDRSEAMLLDDHLAVMLHESAVSNANERPFAIPALPQRRI